MIIEISLIALVIVVLLSMNWKKSAKEVPVANPSVTSPQPAQVKRALRIEGAETFDQDRSVLAGFGLGQLHVEDVKMFKCPAEPLALSDLPANIAECIQGSYSQGHGRGLDLAYFLAGQRLLKFGEALYFVLVTPVHANAFIVSFLAKTR
ncbi:MAG: hypothetical protein Q7S87_16405 [Agitococcus sp.]|nr:hypothetical protein [Agitococcus sp.]MDO9176961.1 hypothetical protein [Agitococcus sp.]